jgi:hypothetical protein
MSAAGRVAAVWMLVPGLAVAADRVVSLVPEALPAEAAPEAVQEAVDAAHQKATGHSTPRSDPVKHPGQEVVFGPAYDPTHVTAAGSLDYPGRVPLEGAFVGGLGLSFGSGST